MIDLEKARQFVATLSEEDLEDEEKIEKFNSFFVENCEQLDAEFINKIINNKDLETENRVALMEEYAYKGSAAAQLTVGVMKLEGNGMTQNIPEAIFWLRRSYNGNNPKAGLILAGIYVNGISVKENLFKAREYVKASADQGVPKAQYLYALMLLDGDGGSIDENAAIEYMFFAANGGSEEALQFLQENELIKT